MTLVGYRVTIPQAPNYDHWHFCLDNLYWSVLRLVLNNSASWRDIKLKFWLCHENPGMGYRCAVLDIKDGQTFIADIRAADPRSYSTVGRGFSGRLLLIKVSRRCFNKGTSNMATWINRLKGPFLSHQKAENQCRFLGAVHRGYLHYYTTYSLLWLRFPVYLQHKILTLPKVTSLLTNFFAWITKPAPLQRNKRLFKTAQPLKQDSGSITTAPFGATQFSHRQGTLQTYLLTSP